MNARWPRTAPKSHPLGIAFVLLALATGAAPPDVVRVRVPTDRVAKWFPPGTELKGMSAEGFESLVRDALAGPATSNRDVLPRLLRASHSARWEGGVLIGRSELIVAPPRSGPGSLPLEPWTPAIEPAAGGRAAVRSDGSGRTFLRVEPGDKAGQPVTAVVSWQLAARPGSRGRKFALGLPGDGVSELTLDLPPGLAPQGPVDLWRGPTPGDGRARWVLVGTPGLRDLLLFDQGSEPLPAGGTELWVEGATRVDVDESAAAWALDWSVWGGPLAPRQLLVSLDPGLDLVAVTGSVVESFRAAPAPDGSTRLTVQLRGPLSGVGKAAARVEVRALARVPSEGRWAVPAARPVGAVWTGGATSVRVAPSRVIEAVRPLAGRRTASPAGEPADDHRLDFVADRPAPVAELVFRRPRADVSAEVRGLLQVGNTAPRLSCRLTWSIHRGRLHDLEIDLPRAWLADRVAIEGLDEPVSWHTEDLPDGGTRVHVTSPSGDWAERSLVLNLSATSSVAGGRGGLTLPRVRPVGARLADEVWLARVESGMTLRPTRARGLAWLDPVAASGPFSSWPGPAPPAEPARPALAWRWTADDADARVERERSDVNPRGSVTLTATVAPDRLVLDAKIALVCRDEPVRALTLGLTEPVADPDAWRVFDESTGQELPHTPLSAKARALAGDLGRGPAWQVELPHAQRGRISLTARYEGRWDGHGRIPLVVLPAPLRARGTLLVVAGLNVRTTAAFEGARALDPTMTVESLAAEEGGTAEPGFPGTNRAAHAWVYDAPGAWVELRAEALAPTDSGGVIRDALLTTAVDPRSRSVRCRLSLRVAPERSSALEVGLPRGSALELVVRDGQPFTPTRAGTGFSIPMKGPAASRPFVDVVLVYRIEAPASADLTVLRPHRPDFSMPCVALAWEVVLPEPWAVADWGPALTPTDPAAARLGPFDALTGGRVRARWDALWRWGRGGGSRNAQAEEMLRGFVARVAGVGTEETSLGEWLTRLDTEAWPIVVDRVALAGAGWGPRSRIVPPRYVPSRPVTASELLRPLALAVTPVGRILLITNRDEAPIDAPRRAEWAAALAQAGAFGSGLSDRFQSVARWREEPMPRVSGSERSELLPPGDGRAVWRFHVAGWPTSRDEVRLVDRGRQSALAWVVCLAVLTLGLAFRRLPLAVRAASGLTLVALGLLATASAPSWRTVAASGLTAGAAALTFLTLGESLPLLRRPRPGDRSGTAPARRRRGPNLTAPTLLALSALASVSSHGFAPPSTPRDAEGPILALFPFDGPPDVSRAPDRVLLRLSDYERLRGLADDEAVSPRATLEAVEARHRVGSTGDRRDSLVVESGLVLAATGRGPANWSFPIDDAREITATVDGRDVPVRVEPGARSASVEIEIRPSEPTYRLVLRRTVAPRRTDGQESIGLGVNPVAVARIEVDAHPSGLQAEVTSARGRVPERDGADGPAGWLGPAARIEVLWSQPGEHKSPRAAVSVEGLYLWDALPAGDRVRARLTYHDATGTGVVRVGLGPGTLVRESSIPGAVDVSLEGTPDRPEWVARVDPPLPDGTTIALDLFRPRGGGPQPDASRVPPRVEPLGVVRSTGILALRHPSDWVGRIAPAAGSEAIGDEAFVRLWGGTLPDEPLTFSGAVKFPATSAGIPPVAVQTGPAPSTLRVRPAVHATISPGRVDLALDADLAELSGPVHEIEIACPDGFRAVRVAADGLTDWSITSAPAPSLRLRFDGPTLHQRRARVEGWIGVDVDPLAAVAVGATREIAAPWPRWPGQDVQPGALTVEGATRISLVQAAGAAVAVPEPGPSNRVSFRVTRADDLGRLRWEVEPPRVSVMVLSQMTIDPDSAEWTAVLRYGVSAGPLDAINLKLPTEWARAASVWVDGVPHRPVAKSRRDPETRREITYWSIRPDRPVWGSRRLVVRSSVVFAAGDARSFPDLSPLGWGGAVDTSLRIVNETRQPISVEGSPGLQPVATPTTGGDDELAAPPRSSTVTSYHVIQSGWSLRVRKPAGPAPGDGPRVAHGEVLCTAAADGSILGSGLYEVGARSGPFLGVAFPAGTSLLWASVNGAPTRPLNAGAGRWQVSLPAEDSLSRVALVWRTDPPGGRPNASPRSIPLPAVGRGPVPVVVTVCAGTADNVASPAGRLTASSDARVALEKADWLARETVGSLPGLDRSSRRDGENLVAALVRFELLLRQAERASALEHVTTPDALDPAAKTSQAARRLRDRLSEAIRAEALDEYETAARIHLGLSGGPAGNSAAPAPETPLAVQVRPIGLPHQFQGVLDDASRATWLIWTPGVGASAPDRGRLFGLAGLSMLLPALFLGVARHPRYSLLLARLALAAGLVLIAWWAGPAWLLAGAGFTVLGRVTRE